MIQLFASTGIGGLLRYLRGHAEATAFDARESQELGEELLSRCFGAGGGGFSYRRDPKGTDRWYNFLAGRTQLICRPLSFVLAGQRTGAICADCEDLSAWYAAAALVLGMFAEVQIGIIAPPREGAEGHAVLRVVRRLAAAPAGLSVPAEGIWDPSVWHGMPAPPVSLYEGANFISLRGD